MSSSLSLRTGSSDTSLFQAATAEHAQIATTSTNEDNHLAHANPTAQKTDIVQTEALNQIRSTLDNSSSPIDPQKLTQILEVIQNALVNPNPEVQQSANDLHSLIERVTTLCAGEFLPKAYGFKKLYTERFKEVEACTQEAAIAQKILEISVANAQDTDKSDHQASSVLNKINAASAAREKLGKCKHEQEQFDTSLQRLKVRLLVHPWKSSPSFEHALRIISACAEVTKFSNSQTTGSETAAPAAQKRPVDNAIYDQALIAIDSGEYQKALDLMNNNPMVYGLKNISDESLEQLTRLQIQVKAYQGLGKHADTEIYASSAAQLSSLEHKKRPLGQLYLALINAYCSLGEGEAALKTANQALGDLSIETECGQDIHVYLYLAGIRAWCLNHGVGKEVEGILAADYASPLDKVNAFQECYMAMEKNGHDMTWLKGIEDWNRRAQDMASILHH